VHGRAARLRVLHEPHLRRGAQPGPRRHLKV
jgi:hypothetical protein